MKARRHFPWPLARSAIPAILMLSLLSCGAQTAATYHARADEALQSFLTKFWDGGPQYLKRSFPSDGFLTGYWLYAHGWEALLDGVERTGGQQYSGLIESFYLGQNDYGWTNNYYDDECWMTMALTRAYDLTSDVKYLNQATALYADIMGGWDMSCCGGTPGGMWWDKTHTQKATASNAGAALAGARLFLRTGNAAYLTFAQQVYSYWYSTMVHSVTHQVCDNIQPDGTMVWWRFTYNEGLMIGASVALNEATGDSTYLTKAHEIAGFMISQEITSTSYGPVLYDGDNSGCGGDCHEFKGPAYRYLMQLYAKDTSKSQYYTVLKASADALWNLARTTASTIFSVNWAGPPQSTVDQAQDNEACIALSRFAQQYGAYPGSGIPGDQYEAENGTVHHILLENIYGAYTGWGYVAGWNGDGQWIDFKVNCPMTAKYLLTFRYAAGAGDAVRLIYIDGVNAFPRQTFPNTGAWSSYNTVNVVYYFPAGSHTISVIYNSSLNSANYLNLDNLVVTAQPIRIIAKYLVPGFIRIDWGTTPGEIYRVQVRDSLVTGEWADLGAPITANGTTASMEDPIGGRLMRYYRIVSQH